ncbi:hypothetical protein [Escherichia coli]|uniref:hypothetical protein n=1 Tax=Escherichia coli TaxID=562 RepID=UPI003D011A85
MKLSRQTTSDTSVDGRSRAYAWGRVHYFIIEHAPMAELVAIDELLEKAGWSNDGCPNYEKDDEFGNAGYSCGYWIDIDSVGSFKADYKRLKGEISAHIASKAAEVEIRVLDSMSDKECKDVASVASTVRRDLRTQSESLHSLRTIVTVDHYNPYVTTSRPLSISAWTLIHDCLKTGTINDVCSRLSSLILHSEAAIARCKGSSDYSSEHAQLSFFAGNDYVTRRTLVDAAHEEALRMNRRFDERIAMNADSDARRLQCEFNLSNHVVQRRTVESAHIQALNEDVTRSQAEPRCPEKLLLNMTSHEEVRDSLSAC